MRKNSKLQDELTELIDKTELKKFKTESKIYDFRDLMLKRINKILIVCSLYDYYILIEDGHLQEAIYNEFMELNLYNSPNIQRLYTGKKALELIKKEKFDLVIATMRIGDMGLDEFCIEVKKINQDLPVVILASHSQELSLLKNEGKLDFFDKVFIWTGDRRIFLAIIKYFEDLYNAPKDCLEFGVMAIILVEDSPEYYSAYLPLLYSEIMKQSQKLIVDGINSAEKMLRQRARPKILLAENYEEAWKLITKYKDSLLSIITDLEFQRNGKIEKDVGIKLINEVKKKIPGIPILLQTSQEDKKDIAKELNVSFINKSSRTLLMELRQFMFNNLGFGEFIFRMPDGSEVIRAKTIKSFRNKLNFIPEESFLYHSNRNHFSLWFIARTEFELANKIRPITINQFNNSKELRQQLINVINKHLEKNHRGIISVYSRKEINKDLKFQLIGEGSIGGKARGLTFFDKIMKDYINPNYFPDIQIFIPDTVILGTDVFSEFMELNNLYPIAVKNIPDKQILREFQKADLPSVILGDLADLLDIIRYPIAVRSSSLLEDAMYQPFAGIYATVMVPNSNIKKEVRFYNLVQAIKYVYASTFLKNAKNYIEATGNRIEEEKMAIILQEIVGNKFGDYYYPHFSGVSRSYNYYSFGKAKATDGVVNLALGLGKTIVDGGKSLQYSPEYPTIYPQFGTTKDYFYKSQTDFWALNLANEVIEEVPNENMHLSNLHIEEAEKYGSIKFLASTYSSENDMIYEGTTRKGPRILTFAPILKSNVILLNDVLKLVTRMSEVAINAPVEIEFAVNLDNESATPSKFAFLQVRPMVKPDRDVNIDLDNINQEDILIKSDLSLGNGQYDLNYVLYVKPESFNASMTKQIANEISKFNKQMTKDQKKYLLIGPGRWGSSDSWLGIPVDFSDITGAKVIVETQIPNMTVDPSQGSHFFQNLTSFKIAYITVKAYGKNYYIDWDWLDKQNVIAETKYIKLISVEKPLITKIKGLTGFGIILKG